MAPRILIFSIVLGAEYSFYLKSIATYAPAFLRYNNSVLAIVLQAWFFDHAKNISLLEIDPTHWQGMNYYVNFLGGIGSNGFHIK